MAAASDWPSWMAAGWHKTGVENRFGVRAGIKGNYHSIFENTHLQSLTLHLLINAGGVGLGRGAVFHKTTIKLQHGCIEMNVPSKAKQSQQLLRTSVVRGDPLTLRAIARSFSNARLSNFNASFSSRMAS